MTRFLALVAAAAAWVGSITGISTLSEPLPGGGVLEFPTTAGISGTLVLRFLQPPPAGARVALVTQTSPTGLPVPHAAKPPHLLVAFSLRSDREITVADTPEVRVTVPPGTRLVPPYGVEVYELDPGGSASLGSYAANVSGGTIVTHPSSCPIPPANGIECPARIFRAGVTYVFEVLQDPPLSQLPPTGIRLRPPG